jgi:hypothetical protein
MFQDRVCVYSQLPTLARRSLLYLASRMPVDSKLPNAELTVFALLCHHK